MDTVDILYQISDWISAFLSLGNIFVIILVIKFESLKTKQNAFVVLLALSDSIYGLIVLPSTNILNAIHTPNMSDSVYDPWLIGCEFRCFCLTLGYYGDYLSIAIVTFDRFCYIKFPFKVSVHF